MRVRVELRVAEAGQQTQSRRPRSLIHRQQLGNRLWRHVAERLGDARKLGLAGGQHCERYLKQPAELRDADQLLVTIVDELTVRNGHLKDYF